MKTRQRLIVTLLLAISMGMQVVAATKEAYAVYNKSNATLTFYYDDNINSWGSNRYDTYEMNGPETSPGWYDDHGSDIWTVVFNESFKDARPTTTSYWFAVNIDNEGVVSHLTTIKDFQYLDTSCVTDMSYMFQDCSCLTSLDLSGFDTSNVTNMSYMFSGCKNLERLDLRSFNTANVTDMCCMFYDCYCLSTIDLSSFNTENVKNMRSMFSYCKKLENLDLNSFNTSKVWNMNGIFRACSGLTSLNLSGWDTGNVETMDFMFYDCSNLKSIYCASGWSTENVRYSSLMFDGCISLMGEEGTTYDENHKDMEYAHVDGGAGNPGYLSEKIYGLYIGGTQLTVYNCYDLPFEGVDYILGSNTLILENSDMSLNNVECINVSNYNGKLTIIVNGTCMLKTDDVPLCINNSDVTIIGPGKLELISTGNEGISLSGSTLVLKDVDMEVLGYDCAIKGEKQSTCEFEVNHSSLYANSQTNNSPTIKDIDNFTLVDAEFDDFNANYHSGSCVYYGECFYYDTEHFFLCYEGKYYEDDMGYYDYLQGYWTYGFYVTPKPKGISTGEVLQVTSDKIQATSEGWYTIDGRKINGKPTKKGIYIRNGKAVVN